MKKNAPRTTFPYAAAGIILEEQEAHACVLADDGWPHYASIEAQEPAKWRRALASLADPETPTLGKHRRPNLRKPLWLGLEVKPGMELPMRLLALVLLPKGRLSLVTPQELDDYGRRTDACPGCRFDRAELLAHYVMRVRPQSQDEMLLEAADSLGLAAVRSRARG